MTAKTLLIAAFLLPLVPDSLALPRQKTEIANSTISNVNTNARIHAINGSEVNTGIRAREATISNSDLSNRFQGNISARANSDVSTGIRIDSGTVGNSRISTDTQANIHAVDGRVRTGVDLNNASHADVSTRVRGNITAIGASANVGSVEGSVRHKRISTNVEVDDVQARGRNVNIGSVTVDHSFRPAGSSRRDEGAGAGAGVGNVHVQSNMVRQVDVSVGSGSMRQSTRARHMAKLYEDKGGVDPSGTKHVYVGQRTRRQAEKGEASEGNVYVGNDPRIRRINTVVD